MDHSHHNHEQHMHVASADMNLDNVISSPNQGNFSNKIMNIWKIHNYETSQLEEKA